MKPHSKFLMEPVNLNFLSCKMCLVYLLSTFYDGENPQVKFLISSISYHVSYFVQQLCIFNPLSALTVLYVCVGGKQKKIHQILTKLPILTLLLVLQPLQLLAVICLPYVLTKQVQIPNEAKNSFFIYLYYVVAPSWCVDDIHLLLVVLIPFQQGKKKIWRVTTIQVQHLNSTNGLIIR